MLSITSWLEKIVTTITVLSTIVHIVASHVRAHMRMCTILARKITHAQTGLGGCGRAYIIMQILLPIYYDHTNLQILQIVYVPWLYHVWTSHYPLVVILDIETIA